MRLFGSERIRNIMDALKIPDDEPIDQKMLSNAIEQAQRKVESRNFQSRKYVLEYDDVMNRQRELIYGQRAQVLAGEDIHAQILGMIDGTIDAAVREAASGKNYLDVPQADEVIKKFTKVFIAPGEKLYDKSELDNL